MNYIEETFVLQAIVLNFGDLLVLGDGSWQQEKFQNNISKIMPAMDSIYTTLTFCLVSMFVQISLSII